MIWPADTLRHFCHHFADSAPWLLGGAFLGVALNRWIKTAWVERWMQTGRTPVIAATVAGALLPGCAMTTMPLAFSLRKKGASVGALTAFVTITSVLGCSAKAVETRLHHARQFLRESLALWVK